MPVEVVEEVVEVAEIAEEVVEIEIEVAEVAEEWVTVMIEEIVKSLLTKHHVPYCQYTPVISIKSWSQSTRSNNESNIKNIFKSC